MPGGNHEESCIFLVVVYGWLFLGRSKAMPSDDAASERYGRDRHQLSRRKGADAQYG